MSWRVVVITKRAKVDFKMNQMVIRSYDDEKRVYLQEIAVVVFESTAISVTTYLLCELSKYKIKVVFCDEKRNPQQELCPYYTNFSTTAKIRKQQSWNREFMALLWQQIVKRKILNQHQTLKKAGKPNADLLLEYIAGVERNDSTNREAHAAKVYFHNLFGPHFSRADEENYINHALDYGYSIILSAINREIAISGYLTQLGIFHDNTFNEFNLSSDMIEILRPLVDYRVYTFSMAPLDIDKKRQLIGLLDYMVTVENQQMHMLTAIRIYCNSMIKSLNRNDISAVKWISYEL